MMFAGGGLRSIQRVVLRQAPANLQRGLEAVGGRLILTADTLLFQPHAFNVQTRSLAVPLSAIVSLQPRWTRLFGLLPVAPTDLIGRAVGQRRRTSLRHWQTGPMDRCHSQRT